MNIQAPSTLCVSCQNFNGGKHSFSCNGCISGNYKNYQFAEKVPADNGAELKKKPLFPFVVIDDELFVIALPDKETIEEAFRLFSPSYFFRTGELEKQHSWLGVCREVQGKNMYMVSGSNEDRLVFPFLDPTYQHETVCWRPVLIHLDKQTRLPAPLLEPGDSISMGTMKMNGQIITSQMSRFNTYRSGEYLSIGDTSINAYDNIEWVQIGHVLLSRYNLLGRISAIDLRYHGLGCSIDEASDRINFGR